MYAADSRGGELRGGEGAGGEPTLLRGGGQTPGVLRALSLLAQ